MVFKENDVGVDDNNALLCAKRLDVYANDKENIIQGGHLVEVVSYDRKKAL